MEKQFIVGDKVLKPTGYQFEGTIVSVFNTTNNDVRYVVEMHGNGMLHIFNASQLTIDERTEEERVAAAIQKYQLLNTK